MAGQRSLKFAGAAVLLVGCASFSSTAMAGFQWVPPGETATAPSMSGAEAMPPAQSYARPKQAPAPQLPEINEPEVISPVVITGSENADAPLDNPMPAPLPMKPHAPSQTQMQSSEDVVQGFAKSVPLAVALRQILPADYTFSIAPDVDAGTLISYKGGRGWHETLSDALAPAGLAMREEGLMVSVGRAHAAAAPATVRSTALASTPKKTVKGKVPPKKPVASAKYLALPPAVPAPMASNAPMAAETGVAETWAADRGEHLSKVLSRWCNRAHVEYNWTSEYDYPLQASVSFSGSFESAVRNLLTGFQSAQPQPVAELHRNSNMGQVVLVVQTRGNPNSD